MAHFFGNIVDGGMILNEIGKIAHQCRKDISAHFPHVMVDEFVVMPNHVHGVLFVGGGDDVGGRDVALQRLYDGTHDGTRTVISPTNGYFSNISPKQGMLGTIIRSYKSACTYLINKSHIGHFKRQANYYDHIIMDDVALFHIREYIKNNPKQWQKDRNALDAFYL